jgi:phage-related protein
MGTCLTPVLPTMSDIEKTFSNIRLPSLPTFPQPFFGNLHIPDVELQHWITEVQHLFYGGLVMSVLKPIVSLLALDLVKIIPKIPGLGDITILDFLAGNYQKIKMAIEYAIKHQVQAFLSLFPPLFDQLKTIPIQIAHMIQMTFSTAIKDIIDIITSLSSVVVSTISSITQGATVIAQLVKVTIPDVQKIMTGVLSSVQNKLQHFSFPGFPNISFASLGKIVSPYMQAIKSMPMIMMNLMIEMMKPMVKFVDDIASFIGGFVWPKLCIDPVRGFYLG